MQKIIGNKVVWHQFIVLGVAKQITSLPVTTTCVVGAVLSIFVAFATKFCIGRVVVYILDLKVANSIPKAKGMSYLPS